MPAKKLLVQINDQKKDALGGDIVGIRRNIEIANDRISDCEIRSTLISDYERSLDSNPLSSDEMVMNRHQIDDYHMEIIIIRSKIIEFERQIKALTQEWVRLNEKNKMITKAINKSEKNIIKKDQQKADKSAEDIINGANK